MPGDAVSTLLQLVTIIEDLGLAYAVGGSLASSMHGDPPHRVWFFCKLEDGLTTRSELHEALYKALTEQGIEIPVPLQDVRLHGQGAAG